MRTVVGNIGRLVLRPDARGAKAVDGAAMVVENGRVEWVGRQDELKSAIEIDVGGRLVTPGLIDAHTHLVFGGNRADEFAIRTAGATYEEIAAQGGGIQSTVAKTRLATDDELFDSGLERAKWMLANGTTGFESKTGYGLDTDTELKCLAALKRIASATGMRTSATLLPLHAVPKERSTRAEYVDYALGEMLPAILEAAPEVEWLDAFVEQGYFEAEDAQRLAEFATKNDLGLRLHVDQLRESGGAVLAARLAAKTADHLEHTGAEGISALKASGTIPVLLPASVFALGKSKYPDVRAMLDVGLPVVLATDFNPGSAPTPCLPFVMSLACTHMGMSPDEALAAVTVNAARSLEWHAGALEPGMSADFVIWDVAHEHELPYWIGAPIAKSVFVEGNSVWSR